MCVSEGDCGAQFSCVSGRCLGRGAIAAITSSHRYVFAPVDAACVSREGTSVRSRSLATLGRGDGAVAFFRFSTDLPADADVVEAYLLLERATDIDADPGSLALHAARVSQPWDGSAMTWAHQPRIDEIGAPVTRWRYGASGTIRLDVRAIVKRWLRQDGGEFGIAVITEGTNRTGVSFALEPRPGARDRADPVLGPLSGMPSAEAAAASTMAEQPRLANVGPELELYVK